MWMTEHHAALNAVQGGFNGAWQDLINLKFTETKSRQLGISLASQENAKRYASLGWFGKLLQGGYYAHLDAALSQAYEGEQAELRSHAAELTKPPTLRGVGLGSSGEIRYFYSIPDVTLPQSLIVTHDAAEGLLEPLKRVKAWMHQTHTPHVPGKFFPISWGLMVTGADTQNPSLVCGYAAPEGNPVEYAAQPMGEVLKALAA